MSEQGKPVRWRTGKIIGSQVWTTGTPRHQLIADATTEDDAAQIVRQRNALVDLWERLCIHQARDPEINAVTITEDDLATTLGLARRHTDGSAALEVPA